MVTLADGIEEDDAVFCNLALCSAERVVWPLDYAVAVGIDVAGTFRCARDFDRPRAAVLQAAVVVQCAHALGVERPLAAIEFARRPARLLVGAHYVSLPSPWLKIGSHRSHWWSMARRRVGQVDRA